MKIWQFTVHKVKKKCAGQISNVNADYLYLWECLTNHFGRYLLKHISVSSTPTEPSCDLYCIYAQNTLVTVAEKERTLSRNANMLRPSIMMTYDFVLVQLSTTSFSLLNFIQKACVNQWWFFYNLRSTKTKGMCRANQ